MTSFEEHIKNLCKEANLGPIEMLEGGVAKIHIDVVDKFERNILVEYHDDKIHIYHPIILVKNIEKMLTDSPRLFDLYKKSLLRNSSLFNLKNDIAWMLKVFGDSISLSCHYSDQPEAVNADYFPKVIHCLIEEGYNNIHMGR